MTSETRPPSGPKQENRFALSILRDCGLTLRFRSASFWNQFQFWGGFLSADFEFWNRVGCDVMKALFFSFPLVRSLNKSRATNHKKVPCPPPFGSTNRGS